MPHGSKILFSFIGKPISPEDIMPFCFDNFSFSIFAKTCPDIPVVYEFIKKNNGLLLNTLEHSSTKSSILFSNCQTSPDAPLP